jgi:uncharacterized coiled-coil DUF342 family protein
MEWQDFAEMCEATLAVIDELPDRAEDFRESASETVQSMKEWAEEHEHVTDKMVTALENIDEGASKWVSW